jgi:uncharacterized protein (DUF111 family)
MRVAYLDCVGGLAGDMLLAALLDAGAAEEALQAVPEAIGLERVEIAAERVERQGIGALHVRVDAPHDHADRRYRDIRLLLEESALTEAVRARSLDAFARLAAVEARIHGVELDDVHFHELGAVDTLVDVCGAFTLLEELGVELVACSPLPFARGLTRAAHGVLPLPAPATLGLLEGAPLAGVETEAETELARVLLHETTALGVRVRRLGRYELEREEKVVGVDGGTVRVKVGLLEGRVVNVAPEHDDCARVARETGRAVKSVWAEALARAQER